MLKSLRFILIVFIVINTTNLYAVEKISGSNHKIFENYFQLVGKMWNEFEPINRIYKLGYIDKKYSENIKGMSDSTIEHIIMLYKSTSHISALAQLLDSTYDVKKKCYNNKSLTIILDQLLFEKYFVNRDQETYDLLKSIEDTNPGMKELKREILYQYHEKLGKLTTEINHSLGILIKEVEKIKSF